MAAGSGERMDSKVPKQFLEINNQPILAYTFKKFRKGPGHTPQKEIKKKTNKKQKT